MESNESVDIVVTAWQRESMTANALYALRLNTTTPHRIILIDNGSKKVYWTQFMNQTDVYVKLDKNYGLEYAKHLGMQFVTSKYFVSTDNDILPYRYENPDWLGRLVDLMNKNPEYGAIAPRPQILMGTRMDMFNTSDEIVPFPHVPGYCRIMRTDWVNEVGAWNDKRPLRGHEEMWIGQKFAEKGWKLGWANNVRCWHLFGKEDTDIWGYGKDSKPEDHGHNPIWPIPKNDIQAIKEGVGIDVEG